MATERRRSRMSFKRQSMSLIPNLLTTAEVCNWMKRNVNVIDETLEEAVIDYIHHHPEIGEKYVAGCLTEDQLERWLEEKKNVFPPKNGFELPSPIDLTEDVLPLVEAGESYTLFLRLAIVLQRAVNADKVEVRFDERPNSPIQNTFLTLVDMEESEMNRCLTVNILFAHETEKAILKIMRLPDKDPFNMIERDLVVFVSNVLSTCFCLYQCAGKEKLDGLLNAIIPTESSLNLEPEMLTEVIHKILSHARRLLLADRTTLFLLNEETNELVAEYFSFHEGVSSYKDEIRCALNEGFAGRAAATMEVFNIKDCYADPRFNENIDKATGYVTKNLLSCPVIYCDKVIGVLEAINKIGNSAFTRADEKAAQSLTTYCSLVLHLAKLHGKIKTEETKLNIAMEMLKYHSQVREEDVADLIRMPYLKSSPPLIDDIAFDYLALKDSEIPKLFIHMSQRLFHEECFPIEKLCTFIQTVVLNYRDVSYHNIKHAFNVAHSMYLMVKDAKDSFPVIEMKSLLIACICHDLDHRGYTNDFLQKVGAPLASLYQDSILERHHYQLTISILQEDKNNIFCKSTSQEYKKILDDMEPLILATDLALYSSNKEALEQEYRDKSFDINDPESRLKLKKMMMTGCDLSAVSKPWPIYNRAITNMYREFYTQGDKERERGEELRSMMDRQRQDCIPIDQIRFLEAMCISCYQLIADSLPYTKPFLTGCNNNIRRWKKLLDSGHPFSPILKTRYSHGEPAEHTIEEVA